jgi:hypothetical protein
MKKCLIFIVLFLLIGNVSFAQKGRGYSGRNVTPRSDGWAPYYSGRNYIQPGFRYNNNGSYNVRYGPSSFYYLPGYQPNYWVNSPIYPGMVNTYPQYYYYYDMYTNTYRYYPR